MRRSDVRRSDLQLTPAVLGMQTVVVSAVAQWVVRTPRRCLQVALSPNGGLSLWHDMQDTLDFCSSGLIHVIATMCALDICSTRAA